MPKKRNTYWSRNKKQKQLITARLMEISFKVDDYVYNHKPISDRDAKLYMKEVASYKTQCWDERSLQVIEKLTRCMKAIIIDHQERGDSYEEEEEENNKRPVSSSTVYSMPDADRTYLTQADEDALNISEPNNDVETIDLVENDDDENNEANTTTAAEGSGINVEVDLHRGMSSLSLKDGEPSYCSQSILDNFEGIIEAIQLQNTTVHSDESNSTVKVSNIDAKAKTANVIQAGKEIVLPVIRCSNTAPIIKPPRIDHVKNNNALNKTNNLDQNNSNSKSKIIRVNKEPKKVMKTKDNGLIKNTLKMEHSTFQTLFSAINIIPVIQTHTWYDSNKTCTIIDSRDTVKRTYKTQPAHIFEHVNQNKSTVRNVPEFNASIPINSYSTKENSEHSPNATGTSTFQQNQAPTKKMKRVPRKKVSNENEKPKNKRGSKLKGNSQTNSKKKKNVPIYNKNVENDLSWIENIRFVREIREDENDTKLNLEDSFWDNYYLPNNWNENDFL